MPRTDPPGAWTVPSSSSTSYSRYGVTPSYSRYGVTLTSRISELSMRYVGWLYEVIVTSVSDSGREKSSSITMLGRLVRDSRAFCFRLGNVPEKSMLFRSCMEKMNSSFWAGTCTGNIIYTNYIHGEYYIHKLHTRRILYTQITYTANIIYTNYIHGEYYIHKLHTRGILYTQITYTGNIIYTNYIHGEYYIHKLHTQGILYTQITYTANMEKLHPQYKKTY
jgi:hypothetical protein